MENKIINKLGWAFFLLACIVCFKGIPIKQNVTVKLETATYYPLEIRIK